MDTIITRWQLINKRIVDLEADLDQEIAFWDNTEYNDLFEERARLNTIFSTCKYEVDKEVIKGAYRKQNRQAIAKANGKDYTTTMWITINPADGNETAFIAKVHKFMARKCIHGTYVFEQRGETDGDFHGLHVHALIQTYPNLKRDLITQFKKFCDSNHIKIMPCSQSDVDKRTIYMNGTKEGEAKQPKVLNDPLMRSHYDLLPLYTC